jgi:hypothetical protein
MLSTGASQCSSQISEYFASFFLWFLVVLRSTEGEQSSLSSTALAGGVMFVALEMAGASVEIIYPRPRPASRTFNRTLN